MANAPKCCRNRFFFFLCYFFVFDVFCNENARNHLNRNHHKTHWLLVPLNVGFESSDRPMRTAATENKIKRVSLKQRGKSVCAFFPFRHVFDAITYYFFFKRLSNVDDGILLPLEQGNPAKMNVLNNAAGYLVAVLYRRCMRRSVRIV